MTDTQYLAAASTSRSSTMIKFKFTGVTDDTAKTPVLLSYDCKAVLFPPIKKLYYTKLRLGEGVVDRQGSPTSNWQTLQETCLTNCRNAAWPVTMVDFITSISGTTSYVKLLPIPQDEQFRKVIRYENNRPVEWEYTLLLLSTPLV
jgi:hypothetical protein